MARVFVDTNVLFPFSLMDLMLALTEDGVHEIVWTDRLLDEWERVIVRDRQRTPASAHAITRAVRTFFHDCRLPEAEYEHLIETVPGADPDDRHHIAAAVAARAGIIVTWNLQDFPAAPLNELGVRVQDPDSYLCGLLDTVPAEVIATVRRLAAEKDRPPMSAQDLSERVGKSGAVTFAGRVDEALRGGPSDYIV